MSVVFVDTWAWYALADTTDTDHKTAQVTNDRLLAEGCTFVTTNFVLDETITLIRYNIHHNAAVRFWRTMQKLINAGLVELVRVDEIHEANAWKLFERYSVSSQKTGAW